MEKSSYLCTLKTNGMQYVEVKFDYSFEEDYLLDLFVQGLADLGFESFTDDAAYIPAQLFDEQALRAYASEHGQMIRSVSLVPDENWNAAWETEHPVLELALGVRITPHCAFGAGHHGTTSMMIDALLDQDLTGKTVLDMGCGTGVLGIFAIKRGASYVISVDIDDKSVANTKENALANNVSLDVRLGDSPPQGEYDLILANIHRNILISQMPAYAKYLKVGGEVWMSGFYESDCQDIISKGSCYGLRTISKNLRGEWCCIRFSKE